MREGRPQRFEEFGNVRGEFLYLDVYKAPFRDERGHIIGTVGCGRIVTEERRIEEKRRRSEEALRESEQRFRSLFNGSEDGIFITDEDGAIVDANEALMEFLGYDEREILGTLVQSLVEDPDRLGLLFAELHSLNSVKDYRLKMRTKVGAVIDCLLTANIRLSEDGSIRGYQGILRDVTERERLQQQLFEQQKMEALGSLAGGIAHDFNNILYAIIGFTELALERDREDTNLQSYLETVLMSSQRAKDLVNQILTFSRQGRQEKSVVNVVPMVKEAIKFLRGHFAHYYRDQADN